MHALPAYVARSAFALVLLLITLLPAQAWAIAPLAAEDVRWLNRIGYGLDSAMLANYRKLGRDAFLAQQLQARQTEPIALQEQLKTLMERASPTELLAERRDMMRKARSMDAGARKAAMDASRKASREVAQRAGQRLVARALASPNQLLEKTTAFWLNHFSVFARKGDVGDATADYAEHLRQHALGNFRDLLRAGLTHPAMLLFLDNARNQKDKLNENLAREALELHTLGVGSGYSQADVEALARVLTGLTVAPPRTAARKPREGAEPITLASGSVFIAARHDASRKRLLGTALEGSGLRELEQAIDLMARHPATRKRICKRLAIWFVADNPSPALLHLMEEAWKRSDGNIATVLQSLFLSPEAGDDKEKFNDPTHYLLATLRFALDGRQVEPAPVLQWLQSMDAAPFMHSTPDGYGLTAEFWNSPAQITRRLEIARQIAAGRLVRGDERPAGRPPRLDGPLFDAAVRPRLSPKTVAVLAKAESAVEWNTVLLASPTFMFR